MPISDHGRIAAWTVVACLTVTGVATVALAWNELTCTVVVDPGGERQTPTSVCEVLGGIGGVLSILGLLAAGAGIAIALSVRRRPVTASGGDGWRWALAVLTTIGLAVLATRFPDQTCPPGVHLSAEFELCIDPETDARFDSTSWRWLKLLGIAAAPAIGIAIVAVRKAWPVAVPITLIAWFAGIGWLLLDTIGRELLP